MYLPPAFSHEDVASQHAFMRSCGLGTLVTNGPAGLYASHVPFLLDDEGERGVLRAHLSRGNPHWKNFDATAEALAIFSGADFYVTPEWYATKRETGKVVPTWNYIAVHAYGPLRVVDDAAWVRALVTRLTDRHEAGRDKPWAVADAPDDFIAAQLKGIVGIEIPISRLEGKWKMSQNRPAADRAGVVTGLEAEGQKAAAALVAQSDPAKGKS